MNYKALFQIAMSLISSPAKAWEEIRLERLGGQFLLFLSILDWFMRFIRIHWCFVDQWMGRTASFQLAMTQCCAVAVALFGGYFLAAYAINQMGIKMFGMSNDIPLAQQFAGYALVVTFLLHIVTGLLPDFSIIGWLLQFYIVYVVWEGARVVMLVEEKNRLRYTIFSSILLILCPAVIQVVFNKLTAILN